ncbi:MAG: GspH/FimT family protein [Pseudomonadales bacterium]
MAATKVAYGFSLVELTMALAVSALLLLFAVPTLSTSLDRARLHWRVDGFVNAINQAKFEVLSSGKTVIICRKHSQYQCAGAQYRGRKDWSRGWLAFIDADLNRVYNERDERLLAQLSFNANQCSIVSNRGDFLGIYPADLGLRSSAARLEITCGSIRTSLIINWLGRVRREH